MSVGFTPLLYYICVSVGFTPLVMDLLLYGRQLRICGIYSFTPDDKYVSVKYVSVCLAPLCVCRIYSFMDGSCVSS